MSRVPTYVRHGTSTLFAALEIASGKVTQECFDRHCHQEFLRFPSMNATPIARIAIALIGEVQPDLGGQ